MLSACDDPYVHLFFVNVCAVPHDKRVWRGQKLLLLLRAQRHSATSVREWQSATESQHADPRGETTNTNTVHANKEFSKQDS